MMKYQLLTWLRAVGALTLADNLKLSVNRLKYSVSNLRFKRANPDFPVPPYDLAFDAYNMIDWYTYRSNGLKQAGVFADIIRKECPQPELQIMEWGCGPGRLIRHIASLLSEKRIHLTGTDYNPKTIQWCKQALPDIRFIDNALMPPISFPDASFDVIYNFSVFTHLSEEAQLAWANEHHRLLKPGGLLICTTHGTRCTHLLTTEKDQSQFARGEAVIQGGYDEGKKWFLALHPEKFVKTKLLGAFANVYLYQVPSDANVLQDFWVAHKK